MAISPNVTFVSGAVLTAAQQNAFGFGLVQFGTATVTSTGITTIATQITVAAFTAIASRNYKITYSEPNLICTGIDGEATMTIMVGSTTYNTSIVRTSSSLGLCGSVTAITTFSAGSTVVLCKLTNFNSTNTAANRSATKYALCTIEDVGPA